MAAASHAPGNEPGVGALVQEACDADGAPALGLDTGCEWAPVSDTQRAWRTTGTQDNFDTLIEQLAGRLRCEHKRQIDELVAQVSELKSRLESREQPPAPRPARSFSKLTSWSSNEAKENGGAALQEDGAACSDLGSSPSAATPSPSTAQGRRHWGKAMTMGRMESERSGDGLSSAQRRLRVMASHAPGSSLGLRSREWPCDIIERAVHSVYFELFFGVLIALQGVVMAVEAHHQSIATAADLGYDRHQGSPGGGWGGAEDAFHALELVFGVLFALEVVLRILGLRGGFLYDPWNWFDLGVVTFWVVSKFGSVLPVSPQLIRLTRFARLARLLRLVRLIQGFDSLIVLTTSIRSSAAILGWSGFLLLVVMLFNALALNGLLTEFYFRSAEFPLKERLEIFRYFGSFTASLFSMFELTLANWPPISRALYENVSGWFILVTLVHKFTVGFAVIGIINGVFIQETFRVAQQDDEIMLRRGEKAMCIHASKMKRLVEMADSSGEGMLDIGEFRLMFQDPGIKAWLASMELNPRDVDLLFAMMDDGDGYLSVDEVIRGVGLYKGGARSIDLHMLALEHKKLQALVLRLQNTVLSRLGKSDDNTNM